MTDATQAGGHNKVSFTVGPDKRPMSRIGQREKVQQWRTKASNISEFENKTSELIVEGVRTLQNWDKAVISTNALKDSDAVVPRRPPTPEERQEMDDARKDLLESLRRIKKFVDPTDAITPRVVVSEFEKYVEDKKLGNIPKDASMSLSIGKKVGFGAEKEVVEKPMIHPPFRPRTDPQRPATASTYSHIQNSRPRSRERPNDIVLRPNSLGKRMHAKSEAASTSQKWNKGPEPSFPLVLSKVKEREPPVGSQSSRSPEWWKRKIRQGMIQTDLLMIEMVKQRREDEKYLHADYPYIRGVDPLLQMNPLTTAKILQPNAVLDRIHLQNTLDETKRIHEACFGSCSTSMQGKSKTSSRNRSVAKTATTVSEDQDRMSSVTNLPSTLASMQAKLLVSAATNTTLKPKPDKSTQRRQKSSSRATKVEDTDDIMVLFDRSAAPNKSHPQQPLSQLMEVEPFDQLGNHILSPSNRQALEFVRHNVQMPTPLRKNETHEEEPEPKQHHVFVTDLKAGPVTKPKEWVQRIIQAKKAHENDVVKAVRLRKEKDHAATNALYRELQMNKQRLEGEVNVEKKRLMLNWTDQVTDMNLPDEFAKVAQKLGQSSRVVTAREKYSKSYSPSHGHGKSKSRPQSGSKEQEKKKPQPIRIAFPRSRGQEPRGINDWLEDVVANSRHPQKSFPMNL